MKNFETVVTALVLSLLPLPGLLPTTGILSAQSTAISVDRGDYLIANAQANETKLSVSSSYTPIVRRWERILAQPHREFSGEMTGGQIIQGLRTIGIPVVFDPSSEGEVDEDTEFQIPNLPGSSLYRRLTVSLEEMNVCFAIVGNEFKIISFDDQDEERFYFTATYDVTGLNSNLDSIINVVLESVDSDSWIETGSGDGTLTPISVNGRRLLVISQAYSRHLKIRGLFDQLARRGASGVPYWGDQRWTHSHPSNLVQRAVPSNRNDPGSTAVELPKTGSDVAPMINYAEDWEEAKRPIQRQGGIFSIPSRTFGR